MDVKIFAVFLFLALLAQLVLKSNRSRVVAGCFLFVGIFIFLMSRSLEVFAGCFLVNIALSAFNFKEAFSVVDYRDDSNEWQRTELFLKKNRVRLLALFFAFHAAFFFVFTLVRKRLLDPVEKPQILSFELGSYLNASHWVGVLILFVAVSILLNVNGRAK